MDDMKEKIVTGLALLPLVFSVDARIETSKLKQQAEIKITTYNHQLRATLKDHIALGGLKRNLDACNAVGKNMAVQSSTGGWSLTRTSLKVRNPNNTPDNWEKSQLETFATSFENGKAIRDLKVERLTSIGANRVLYKYMKGIQAEAVCLNCHGTDLTDDVKNHLTKQFPNDLAVGYKVGDLMGAFTLEKIVNTK